LEGQEDIHDSEQTLDDVIIQSGTWFEMESCGETTWQDRVQSEVILAALYLIINTTQVTSDTSTTLQNHSITHIFSFRFSEILTHLNLQQHYEVRGNCYLTDKEAEAETGQVSCPRSHS
jgi:hypothetical protein